MALGRPFPASPRSQLCLQKNCSCLEDAADLLFEGRLDAPSGQLDARQIRDIFGTLRLGGVSLQHVKAAVGKVCSQAAGCRKEEFGELLKELDRRYFIVQSAQWEFQLLDTEGLKSITEEDGLFLFRAVHKERFMVKSWQAFLAGRLLSGTRITWAEIEVPLCDIPEWAEARAQREAESKRAEALQLEREQEERERELARQAAHREAVAKQQAQKEAAALAERLAREKEQEARQREEEERRAREEEERRAREEEERRAREEEERRRKEADEEAWRALQLQKEVEVCAQHEKEARELATEAEERAKNADSEVARIAAEEEQQLALQKAKERRHTRLRAELRQAIGTEEESQLKPAIAAVQKEKVESCEQLLADAQRVLRKLQASKNLDQAVMRRKLAELEAAMVEVRKGGLERDLREQMTEALALLEKLRKLEQMKRAVLGLSQRVVAEIKSYAKPPPVVHTVMSATFLLLGNSETETKSWQATQILIGKTGKEGLKRRVSERRVEAIALNSAHRALQMLKSFNFVSVQEASAGCAVFYAWAEGMIDEVLQRSKSNAGHKAV